MTCSTQREFRYVADGYEKSMEIQAQKIEAILNCACNMKDIRSIHQPDVCPVKKYLDVLDREVGRLSKLALAYKDHCKLWSDTMPEVGDDFEEFRGANNL